MVTPIHNSIKSREAAEVVLETTSAVISFLRRQTRQTASSSMPRIRVLEFLKRCPNSSLTSVSQSLGTTNATSSVLIDALTRAGLVVRETNPAQRRQIILRLTPAGNRHLQAARESRIDEISSLLQSIPPEQLDEIIEIMSELHVTLKQGNEQGLHMEPPVRLSRGRSQ